MILALHAFWHRSLLHVWGETSRGEHPFAADPTQLRAVLGEVSPDALLGSVAVESGARLLLPCDQSGPLPSPRAAEGSGGSAASQRFLCEMLVPTLALDPADAVDLLTTLPQPLPAFCSDSIAYWSRLGQLVLTRLAWRQFFPDVQRSGEGLEACWRLLIHSRQDIDFLERYCEAMPPSCRAVIDAADPATQIESFLMATTDALIRRDVAHDEFFARVHSRAADPSAPPELRWISALLSPEPGVKGFGEEVAPLEQQIRGWTSALDDVHAPAPMRLCCTLQEPPEQLGSEHPCDVRWQVTFALQSLDGTESVEASELFSGVVSSTSMLGRKIATRREQFLAALLVATEHFPLLARVSGSSPTHIEVSTAEAHVFLRDWAPRLQEHGFGVFVPPWAIHAQHELGLQLYLHPMHGSDPSWDDSGSTSLLPVSGSGQMGLNALVEFDWQLALGDVRLSPDEFRSLLQTGSGLIRYRNQWMQIDPESANQALEFLQRAPSGKTTLAQALRTALAASSKDTGLPIVGLAGSSWLDQLLSQTPSTFVQHITQPCGFQGTLRPYQLLGLQWLAFLSGLNIGACLADDMGLGKTIQFIALLLHEREQGPAAPSVSPTVLFVPTSLVGNWARELQRFSPSLRVLVHHGPERFSGEQFLGAVQSHDIVITTYALAHRDVELLRQMKWGRIALDEAQKIKNPSAASTLAIRSLQAPLRVALTGTPIENHLSELWSIMEVLNPGLLGSATEFRRQFAVPIEKLSDQDRSNRLRRLIQPFILRRTKADPRIASDLPEKMEMKVFCNLTIEQARIYQQITDQMLTQIDSSTGIRRRGLILAVITRLKQICNHPALILKDSQALDDRSGKCERLVEMLEEVLEEGDAALVFTQYREMGHLLERLLMQRLRTPILFLHGGTPAGKRDQMVERFNALRSDVRIFLLSLRAGGLGLNLTAANHVFHFDRWWNPAVENQATDRAHRIGQTQAVQVHKFICAGTMEERIDRMLADKRALADKIVGSGDEWLTNFSTAQLRDCLSLSQEAVGEF